MELTSFHPLPMKKLLLRPLSGWFLFFALFGTACTENPVQSPSAETTPPGSVQKEPVGQTDIRIVLHTSKGAIEAILYATKVPLTVANFLNLARHGYYDGLTFHRVIPDFMIQGGDPEGTGGGGPGYQFEDEFSEALRHDAPGVFSMANSGVGTNGSQFFITHVATPWLDRRHSVFGRVTRGQGVVDAIRQGDTIRNIEILDSCEGLFQKQAHRIRQWDEALKAMGY